MVSPDLSRRVQRPPGFLTIALLAPVSASFVFGIGLSLVVPLLAIVLERRGVSASLIGLNSAMAGVAAICATPFAVPLARRFGTFRTMAAGIVLAACSLLLFFPVQSLAVWFLLRISFHGSLTIIFCLSEFWISSAAPPERRGLALGLYGTALSAGFAVGPAILAVVGSEGMAPFWLGAAVMIVTIVPIAIARHHQPVIEPESRGSILRILALAPAMTLAALAFGAVDAGTIALLPVFGTRSGLDVTAMAIVISALGVGFGLSQVPIGLLADRIEKKKLLLGIALSSALWSLAVPALPPTLAVMAAAMFVFGLLISGLYTVGLAALAVRFSGADLGTANAGFIMMYATGMLVGPASMGRAIDVAGPPAMFFVAAGFCAAYAVLVVVRWRAE